MRITRSVLEVLARTRHPVGIVTKSGMVTRDIDLLGPMAEQGLAKVAISLTTLDPRLSRKMEPRAASPALRLETIRRLTNEGIPVSVLVAPVVPAINDHEIERLLEAAYAAGAREAGYVMLRLPSELKELARGLAGRAFSGAGEACDVVGPGHARGQGLRCPMGCAAVRHRADRLGDRSALRDRRAASGLQHATCAPAHRISSPRLIMPRPASWPLF